MSAADLLTEARNMRREVAELNRRADERRREMNAALADVMAFNAAVDALLEAYDAR